MKQSQLCHFLYYCEPVWPICVKGWLLNYPKIIKKIVPVSNIKKAVEKFFIFDKKSP